MKTNICELMAECMATFKSAALCLLLVMVGLVWTAPASRAQSFLTQNFINGTNLLITPLSTNGVGISGVYNYNPQTITSNAVIAVNTFTVPYTYTTNWVFTTNAIVGTTNAAAMKDANLWANRDGTVPFANISIHLTGLDPVQSTNVLTVTVTAIPAGGDIGNFGKSTPVATTAQNQFVFTAQFNPTNDVVIATNMPTAFCQGSGRLRVTIASPSQGTTSGTNGLVKSIRLNGWLPQ